MLDVTREELMKVGGLTPALHPLITSVTNAITNYTVHDRMKAVVAVHHIVAFAAQFNRKIELWDGTPVPINAVSFSICASGAGKDSSHRAAQRCFEPGYKLITEHLEKEARRRAIQRATTAEEEMPEEWEVYRKYLDAIPPYETAVSTGPGLIKLVNDAAKHDTLATTVYTGELGDLLTYSANITENITILAEVYDLGLKEVSYTKGEEHRSAAIDGSSLSSLMMGSPVMLYDETVKYRFQTAFMSKLARRSFFCYVPDELPAPDFMAEDDPILAEIAHERLLQEKAAQARSMMRDGVTAVTKYQLVKAKEPVRTSSRVFELYTIYKRYNNELASTGLNRESTSALIRKHLQWKALKLAGAFAVMGCSETIEEDHYIAAMQYCETLAGDMDLFERDLNKSYYERFSDYCRTLVLIDNKVFVDVHDIKKRGFLSNVNKQKLQEMVNLCASYDKKSIYTIVGDGTAIQFEPIICTDSINLSVKPIDTRKLNAAVLSGDVDAINDAKREVSMGTAYGFETGETTFPALADMLQYDYAYSSFAFRNGVRGKDNIVGGTKFIVLDIDDSVITASEAHFMLMDINHHVALSSDPNNDYKFRVLLELDSSVELNATTWKVFVSLIAEDLGLKVDPLPQSQIFFSYADRPVLSNLDASPLAVRDYIMQANEKVSTKAEPAKLTSAAKQAKLNDPEATFFYAYNAPMGAGSRSMIRAALHAKDLGANYEEITNLIQAINDYWENPMPTDRLEKTILAQVSRMF
jgi:hypothetical protein